MFEQKMAQEVLGEKQLSLTLIVSKHDKTMLYQEGKNEHKVHIEIQIQT